MEIKRYRPMTDKFFWILYASTDIFIFAFTIIPAIFDFKALFIMAPIVLFVNYFFISPLFGYVELREKELFIKFGFFMKRSIPYRKIRALEKQRKFYSESMLSLKNAIEHVNIKYNKFDVMTVSVKNNDEFMREVNFRK